MKYVDKIIFRNKETYNRLYQGSELLFEVQKEPVELDYLTFTAIEPSTIKYEPSRVASAQYSYDKVNWDYAYDITLNLNTGDKVYFKGDIIDNHSNSIYAKFIMTGKVAASGSVMSLQAGNPKDKTLKYHYEFYQLFRDCTSLVKAPELPATTLTEDCYSSMFLGCDSLTEAPELPAKTLAPYCYHYMFFSCNSLVTAPELPSTELSNYCYYDMFNGCTSLVTAPELHSTTLAEGCYYNMFYNCTSLTAAPELPATTLAKSCYFGMFFACRSLTTAPALPATTLAGSCYSSMFYGCSSLTTAPDLPATTLVDYCYSYMFYGCTKIKLSTTKTGEYQTVYRIPKSGTGTTATGALSDMFFNTGGTFAGTPSINTTYYTSNTVV